MSDLSFLSKLVKEYLPEGKVDSSEFTQGVIDAYKNNDPAIVQGILHDRILKSQHEVNINTRLNIEALSTQISQIPYND